MLRKKYRKKTKRTEWCLVSKGGSQVLEWFGVSRPSDERVDAAEARVQYHKHRGK